MDEWKSRGNQDMVKVRVQEKAAVVARHLYKTKSTFLVAKCFVFFLHGRALEIHSPFPIKIRIT